MSVKYRHIVDTSLLQIRKGDSFFLFLVHCHKYEIYTLFDQVPIMMEDTDIYTQIAMFMGPTWGPPGSCRPQVGPILAP